MPQIIFLGEDDLICFVGMAEELAAASKGNAPEYTAIAEMVGDDDDPDRLSFDLTSEQAVVAATVIKHAGDENETLHVVLED